MMISEAYISSSITTRTLLPPFTCTGTVARTFLQPRGKDVLMSVLCLAAYYFRISRLLCLGAVCFVPSNCKQ